MQTGILLLNLYMIVEFILALTKLFFVWQMICLFSNGYFILHVLFLPPDMLGTVLRLAGFTEVFLFLKSSQIIALWSGRE